jgi:hypothetical protein
MFDVPDGYSLMLEGRRDQWTATLIPDGYANEWSDPPKVRARARDPVQAFTDAVAKCRRIESRT